MTWSFQLTQQAQRWANKLALTGYLSHSPGQGYGENTFMMGGFDSTTQPPCAMAVYSWYRECVQARYDYSRPFYQQTGGTVGHFTQVVWKSSTQVGCGVAVGGNKWYIVCQYKPTGNVHYMGNDEKSLTNVGQLKFRAQIPENPADLMTVCKDMYPDKCARYAGQCGQSWGPDFGPSNYCPATCSKC